MHDIDKCCEMSKGLNKFIPQIFKVMKYARQPPHAIESVEDLLATFEDDSRLESLIGFPTFGLKEKEALYVSNPAVTMCQYAGKPVEWGIENCMLLQRSITNLGLGYSFNNVDFWNLYQKTAFNQTFSDVMVPKVTTNRTMILTGSHYPVQNLEQKRFTTKEELSHQNRNQW